MLPPETVTTSGDDIVPVVGPSATSVGQAPSAEGVRSTATKEQPPIQSSTDRIVPQSRLGFRLVAILFALYLSVFIAALDITIVSTAVPTISTHFGSASGYTWIGASYLLADTAAGPTWTNFSDIWGRKPVMLAAISSFIIASVICGRATSMDMLIAGRALQGAGAGGIILLVNIVISDIFDLRYINLPIGALAFTVLAVFLDVHNPRTPIWQGLKAIDWAGSLALLAVTIMTLLGLNFGGDTYSWTSPQVLCLVIIGLSASVFFFVIEAKLAKYPLMPLGVFRNKCNVGTMTLGFLHGMAMIAGEYYLPLYFQSVKGAPPLRSGLLALPFVFLEGIAGIVTGIIIHRTGRYMSLIWIGVLLMTLGFGLFVDLKTSTSIAAIVAIQVVTAIGSGFLLQPPLIAVQANVTQRETASATSTFSFIRNLSQAVSVVIGGVIFSNSMTLQQHHLEASGLSTNITKEFSGPNAAANVIKLPFLPATERQLVQNAYAWSLRNMWIFYAGVAACSILAAALIRSRELSTEHIETRTGLLERERDTAQAVELELPQLRRRVAGGSISQDA